MDAWGSGSLPCLIIGENVEINDYVHISACTRVGIGDNVLMASRVFISDHNHGQYKFHEESSLTSIIPGKRNINSAPIMICENVWIGEQVCILPRVTIGKGAIVGAGSAVTRDVPANSIVAGHPARLIRRFNSVTNCWDRV